MKRNWESPPIDHICLQDAFSKLAWQLTIQTFMIACPMLKGVVLQCTDQISICTLRMTFCAQWVHKKHMCHPIVEISWQRQQSSNGMLYGLQMQRCHWDRMKINNAYGCTKEGGCIHSMDCQGARHQVRHVRTRVPQGPMKLMLWLDVSPSMKPPSTTPALIMKTRICATCWSDIVDSKPNIFDLLNQIIPGPNSS